MSIRNIPDGDTAWGDDVRAMATRLNDIGPLGQSVTFASTVTVDSAAGDTVRVGALTGNITIGAPTNAALGRALTFIFSQDTTGGRTVTWNSAFNAPPPIDTTPSSITVVTFIYDSVTGKWL